MLIPLWPLLDLWCMALDPRIKGGVIDLNTPLAGHLFQIALADAVFAIPAYRTE